MYKVISVDFDYWAKIIFENSKGKSFEIQCSNDFGEKIFNKIFKFQKQKI